MRMPLRSLALLAPASLLAACAVGPDYAPPKIDSPAQFMGQAAVSGRLAPPASEAASWWEGFEDPLLTRLVSAALKQNLDLAAATARVTQVRASLRSADAALLPSAQISANAAAARNSVETPLGRVLNATPGFDRNGELYDANLTASWELDPFCGLRRGHEAAR